MDKILLRAIWLFWFTRVCLGRFVVEKNNVRVTSPNWMKDVYECAIGNFGVPQYGGTMVGTVFYPTGNQKACKPFSSSDVSFKSKAGGMPIFVLVDRGDCYFTLKAWHSQNAGAAAILVADNKMEPLITMDVPEGDDAMAEYLQNLTIPSALISKDLGESIKKALSKNEMVNMNLDWRESLPHPDDRVEYEFWTNSNDECGPKCNSQIEFVKKFKGVAQLMERKGYTRFTPHYITWYCPEAFLMSNQCQSQCINHGRYCSPDPDQDFNKGYDGKDVVVQNLRQVCFFRVANESGKPWLWWDYVADFSIRCPMKENKYNKECAEQVIQSLGVDLDKVNDCIGDIDADMENPVLGNEQEAQVGKGSRGDVTILPTLVINDRQYRGKLDKGAVVKAICSGFEETAEPSLCLTADVETNECLDNNGGCWEDKKANITACRDTFRGKVCECPVIEGVRFTGDGYTHCEASGAMRCKINNGGCWFESRGGRTFSACIDDHTKGCKCPPGFKDKLKCQCPDCKCKNTWGGYECSCTQGLWYMQEHDICISNLGGSGVGWGYIWLILLALCAAGFGAYAVYKYRIRRYMDSEIRAIMAQYMPLDNQVEISNQIVPVDV
ncbi:hypothetical protein V2J09_007073 [Rumex salicifolius]